MRTRWQPRLATITGMVRLPTGHPTGHPTAHPTGHPTAHPTAQLKTNTRSLRATKTRRRKQRASLAVMKWRRNPTKTSLPLRHPIYPPSMAKSSLKTPPRAIRSRHRHERDKRTGKRIFRGGRA
ncbi:MAG: PT domain-containing protein [Polyangiales bacterium]